MTNVWMINYSTAVEKCCFFVVFEIMAPFSSSGCPAVLDRTVHRSVLKSRETGGSVFISGACGGGTAHSGGSLQPQRLLLFTSLRAQVATTGKRQLNWTSISVRSRLSAHIPTVQIRGAFFQKMSERIDALRHRSNTLACVYTTQRGACQCLPAPRHLTPHHRHAETTG